MMPSVFSAENFRSICDTLASSDPDLNSIIQLYGYPPMWSRPNTFESLVHIILEQQVSLASALAALNKLKEKISLVTPVNVLKLSEEELKACYFSRQKTIYVRHMAQAMMNGEFDLVEMEGWSDEKIRSALIRLKGVGQWTSDIYLIFVLQRADIFPSGDLAAVNALKKIKQMPAESLLEAVIQKAKAWQPYRTIATMILWHYYLSVRRKTVNK